MRPAVVLVWSGFGRTSISRLIESFSRRNGSGVGTGVIVGSGIFHSGVVVTLGFGATDGLAVWLPFVMLPLVMLPLPTLMSQGPGDGLGDGDGFGVGVGVDVGAGFSIG
jgi:hypothetical protein